MEYLNPFTLVRWLFLGKSFQDLMTAAARQKTAFETFQERTQRRIERKQIRIDRLAAQNVVHSDHVGKAKLVSDNFALILTKPLATAEDASV